MFIRNSWYVAAWSTEVTSGRLFSRKLLGQAVVFYRTDDGRVAALEDRCCHRFAPLSSGQHEGDCVRCMYHGLVFNASGQCVEVPGEGRISAALRVRSYPTIERDRFIWIWMGELERADPALVPDAHQQDDPDWCAELGGYLRYASNYELIADNLLDLSHAAFVHKATIGASTIAQRRPHVERLDYALQTTHSLPGERRPPFAGALTELPETIDRELRNIWLVRGNFFAQSSVMSPARNADADGGANATADDPRSVRLHTTIALTPETERTTHYFWSTAHNRFATETPDVTALLTRQVAKAFEEDRAIIEAQQRVIDESGEQGMVPIPVDGPFMQVRWMVRKLIDEERGAAGHGASPAPAPRVNG